MKHSLKITIVLIAVFFLSQIVGLLVTSSYMHYDANSGEVSYGNLPMNIERPQIQESSSFIYIMIGVLLGTGIILLLVKFKQTNLWKLWYFFAVAVTLTVAFGSFLSEWFAFSLAIIAGAFKILKPNIWLHNITELFVYSGIAVMFVPVINIFSAIMLLILISIYDAYAVWKSKHMVRMAQFQTKSKLFAGLLIPYSFKKTNMPARAGVSESKNIHRHIRKNAEKKNETPNKSEEKQTAILGGGDIAFSLIFIAVVMKELVINGVSRNIAFLQSLIIVVTVTIALAFLLFKSKKGRFYPAMPFISAGCFVGYGILLLI